MGSLNSVPVLKMMGRGGQRGARGMSRGGRGSGRDSLLPLNRITIYHIHELYSKDCIMVISGTHSYEVIILLNTY